MASGWTDLPLTTMVVSQVSFWLALGIAATFLPRRSAARGHRLLLLAVVAGLLSPWVTVVVRDRGWGVLPAPAVAERLPVPLAPAAPARDLAAQVGPAEHSFPVERAATRPHPSSLGQTASLATWLRQPWLLAWGLLSGGLLLLLGLRFCMAWRMARCAKPVGDAALHRELGRACRRVGLSRAPELRWSRSLYCPVVWGWGRRPVMILPGPVREAVDWPSLLAHELAHLVRRDHFASLVAEVLVCLLPWHPLAWWARRRLATLGERACDDWVLSRGHDAADYADALLYFVPARSPAPALAAVGGRSGIARRIRRILGSRRARPEVGRCWAGLAIAGCVALLGLVSLAQEGDAPLIPKRTPFPLEALLPDRRPIPEQVSTMMSEVGRELDSRRKQGRDAADVAAWQKRYEHLRAQLAGTRPLPPAVSPELHLVAVYEGAYPPGFGHHSFGSVTVRVSRTGAPVVLALASYEPVEWNIELGEGVMLEKVVASGYYRQRVKGAGNGVPVVLRSYQERNGPYLGACYEGGRGAGFEEAARILQAMTGLGITSLSGRYSGEDARFEVGPESRAFRADLLVADVRALQAEVLRDRWAELMERYGGIRFQATRFLGDSAAWGVFTPMGPDVDTLRPLPTGLAHVVYDEPRERYYALNDHDVFTFGPDAPRADKLDLGPDIASLSWPCGLAFDTRRRRLLVATLGGNGNLYAYSVDEGGWSGLADLGDMDYSDIAYDAANDKIFGIAEVDQRGTMLVSLNASGTPIGERKLERDLGLRSGDRTQLIVAGPWLVLLVNRQIGAGRGRDTTTSCYVIDPSSGGIRFAVGQRG